MRVSNRAPPAQFLEGKKSVHAKLMKLARMNNAPRATLHNHRNPDAFYLLKEDLLRSSNTYF